MKGLFTKASIQRHKNEKSVVRNVTGEVLESHSAGSNEDNWLNDPIGTGIKSTQQLLVDWSDYAQHVFFNSAEAKVNMAFDDIINGYPFDGTSAEKSNFLAQIGGFTKYILDQVDTNLGYLKFEGQQYIENNDVTGALAPELSRTVGKSVISKGLHTKGTTVEFWYKRDTPTAVDANPALIYQKKKDTTVTPTGVSVWTHMVGASSNLRVLFQGPPTAGDTITINSPNIKSQYSATGLVITFSSNASDTSFDTSGAANIRISNTLSDMLDDIILLFTTVSGYEASQSSNNLIVSAMYVGTNYNMTFSSSNNSWHGTPFLSNATSPFTEYKINFMISSDNFKSITLESDNLAYDTWHHIAYTYERAATERVNLYINGKLSKTTTNNQSELDNIQLADGQIKIGGSSNGLSTRHQTYAGDTGILKNLIGYLDELRIWLGVRSAQEIKNNYQKNVDASIDLLLNYRFNEPPTSANVSYNAKSVVLDYSGNSYHGLITGYSATHTTREGTQSGHTSPIKYEKPERNPILFPDWETTRELNKNMVISGNHYDRNNPNLITKLIPDHYFEEAQFFEGIETDLETPERLSVENVARPIPGHSKIPPRVVMLSFLLVWANHFDDIKLYIDSFSLLNKVSYDTYNQIPSQVIHFLADYYGISLPNPYSNEVISKFQDGEKIEEDKAYGSPLSQTLDKMWRRILVNLPYLLRSRGTIQGIRALINTLGLESDSLFRFREFGGAPSKQISTARIKKKKRTQFIDFSKVDYLESEDPLWAYRHEPGAPDAAAAPVASEILFQSGDITIVKPDSPPRPTTFTSGSWSWEGRYQLLPTETTASLFRIERTDTNQDMLINLVAMRADDNAGADFTVRLFVDGFKTSPDTKILDIKGVNLWDGHPWHISISNKYLADGTQNVDSEIEVHCIKQSGAFIVEHYSGSIHYDRGSAPLNNNYYNENIPLYEIHNSPSSTVPTLKYFIGNAGNSYNGTFNYLPLTVEQRVQALTTAYSGTVSHMRFWTKFLTKSEKIEHARNPFSVFAKNPVNNSPFPVLSYDNVPLGEISTQFDGALPEGSWERLRQHFDMYQSENTIATNTQLLLQSSVPFSSNIIIHGTAGIEALRKNEIIYTLAPPDFDSNSTENKIRIRGFADKETAELAGVNHGPITELPYEVGVDDRRFSIESSLVHSLNEDIVNMFGDSSIMNNYLGAPELEYAVEYPEIKKSMDIYFQRLSGKVKYNSILEFQRWFNNNFASLVEQFIPHTADFLGINFVIESHMLERHKMQYKQGDVHVDIRDRQAFSQEPLFLGTIRSEIT